MSRSFSRIVVSSVEITPSVGSVVTAGMDAILERSVIRLETLLLQMVVEPGERTAEGQIIEAVTIPWFEIIKHIVKDTDAIFQISPRKWEEIIAGAYTEAGFDEVTLTPRSRDYGRDVIAVKRGIGTVRVIEEVKRYKPGNLVTAKDVRALMGVLAWETASKGFLSTTSDFAPRIKEDPVFKEFYPSRLELINGEMLIRRLKELADKRKGG
jgi:restriction system protein